jgi:hypothetical protein
MTRDDSDDSLSDGYKHKHRMSPIVGLTPRRWVLT